MTLTTHHKLTLSSALWWLCYLAFGTCLVYSSIIYALSHTKSGQNKVSATLQSDHHIAVEQSRINNREVSLRYDPDQNAKLESIHYDEVKAGSLFLKSALEVQPSLVQQSDFVVEVTGMLARVTLLQTFVNNSDDWVEGIYVFPLAQGVAVDQMRMRIGERIIEGQIKERQQAKKVYQQAKLAGKKASLVVQERPNLFTTSVANIPPGETIKINISYLQQIPLTANTFSLRLPLTITPRYIPANQRQETIDQFTNDNIDEQSQPVQIDATVGWSTNTSVVADAERITPWQVDNKFAQKATIKVRLNVGLELANVSSSYHQIIQRNEQGDGATKSSASTINTVSDYVAMDRDFVLTWQIDRTKTPQAAYFSEQKEGHQYAMIMINPPSVKGSSLPIAKDIIYIIDTSGSMGGVAIAQAKKALAFAVTQLRGEDKFNVIEFNSTYSQLFAQSMPANENNRDIAKHWIASLNAGGGTEMHAALDAALTMKTTPKYIRQVIFITDGSVGNEKQLFLLIAAKLAKARLHTVGIGSAPNSYFMERAAQLGRGTYSYIGKVSEVQTQMAQLFDRINQPMLTDIEVTWPSSEVEVLPERIADLYASEPLLINARWPLPTTFKRQGELIISGTLNNQHYQQRLAVTSAMPQSGVATWWARQKIKHLTLQLYRASQYEQRLRLKQQITDTAVEHSLLSKYTSFIAVDKSPSRGLAKRLQLTPVPNAMPQGSNQAIPLANTATSANLQLKVGLIIMALIALWMFIHARPYRPFLLNIIQFKRKG